MAGGDAVTTDRASDDRLWRRSWPTGSSVMGCWKTRWCRRWEGRRRGERTPCEGAEDCRQYRTRRSQGPNTCVELLKLSQAGGGLGMFHHAASSDAPGSYSEAGKPLILIRKRDPHETTQRDRCRDRPRQRLTAWSSWETVLQGVQDFGPACARMQKGEGSLGVMIATCCLEQDPVEVGFTRCLGVDSSTQKLHVAVGHPGAPLKVVRREIPDGRPSRGHLRLVARNFQPDHAEKMFEGR